MTTFRFDVIETPLGQVTVVVDGETLRAVDFEDNQDRMKALLGRHYGDVELVQSPNKLEATMRIAAYFDGEFSAIEKLATATNGTEFQKNVWDVLRTIPAGESRSYQWLANRVGNPKASRAVGMANGANPISIVVPCHRVIGADGRLTGYGGGIERKSWLLRHEKGGQWDHGGPQKPGINVLAMDRPSATPS